MSRSSTVTLTMDEMRATDAILCWRTRGFPHRLRACSLSKWHFLDDGSEHRYDMRLQLDRMTVGHFLRVTGTGVIAGIIGAGGVELLARVVRP